MPRIQLKPHSPEFADDRAPPSARSCDMPGCPAGGEFKAPRDRSLSGHYWFCLEHVQEYNKAWDFFSGMSAREIEDQIVRSTLWDRPTRRYDAYAKHDEDLRRRARQTYHFAEDTSVDPDEATAEAEARARTGINRNTPEYQALAIMGLEPPLDMKTIKTRYKQLVKKYHPDVNPDEPGAEDMLKSINMAYTILKLSCERYEKLTGAPE